MVLNKTGNKLLLVQNEVSATHPSLCCDRYEDHIIHQDDDFYFRCAILSEDDWREEELRDEGDEQQGLA